MWRIVFTTITFGLVMVAQQAPAQQTKYTNVPNLSPSWHGNWEDFSIKTNGDFVRKGVRYKWVGSRARLPRKASCSAFYDGTTSKTSLAIAFNRANTDTISKNRLNQLKGRYQQVTLVCTKQDGEEIPEGADCFRSSYFYDSGVIYEPVTCQIDTKSTIELRIIRKK